MIDFKNVEKYRENNRIEAKRALGGLPYSVWETYSSFANTMGGVILLGVEEGRDKSFHAIDLPSPERLIQKFWRQLNDKRRVNTNILTKDNVRVERVEGKRIVVIEVPRAHRADKPIYIENDIEHGTYRRGGEGDYRCTPEEIAAMKRDAAERSQDMRLIEELSIDDLSCETIAAYRAQMRELRPGHAFERCSNNELLIQLNAAGTGSDGRLHPSAAGLLMFGRYEAICRAFPTYGVCFVNAADDGGGAAEQNLYHFYHQTLAGLHAAFPRSSTAKSAIKEALANCLVNADYRLFGGVLVEKTADTVRFSNPGAFRVDPKKARSESVSDARNKALSHMFVLIGVGAGIGGGISRMVADWRSGAHPTPFFTECFEPERTTLTLPLSKKATQQPDGKAQKHAIPNAAAKQMLVEHLTAAVFARPAQIATALGIPLTRVRRYLAEMKGEGLVISEGEGKHAVFKLRERAGQ